MDTPEQNAERRNGMDAKAAEQAPQRVRGQPFTKTDAAPKLPRMLRVMRWVVGHDETKDRTREQKEYREWLKQDRPGFMRKLADLEKAFGAGQAAESSNGGAGPNGEQKVDEGTERVTALIDGLLDEWTQSQEGRCVTCKEPKPAP